MAALALPGLALAAVCALYIVFAAFGVDPIWPKRDLNLSEAAALREVAEIARLLDLGEDIDRRRPIAAGVLSDEPMSLTPLEGAVASGDGHVIRVLIGRGAQLNAETWRRLRCDTDRAEVIAVLDAHAPSGAAGCGVAPTR